MSGGGLACQPVMLWEIAQHRNLAWLLLAFLLVACFSLALLSHAPHSFEISYTEEEEQLEQAKQITSSIYCIVSHSY